MPKHRQFEERSGLLEVHPEANITFSRPIGCAQLLEIIEARAYELSTERGTLVPLAEATADWFETIWQPAMEAISAADLPTKYSFKTDADRYLWVHEKLRELRTSDRSAGWPEAADARAAEPVRRGHREETLRQRRTPLRRTQR